VATGSFRVYSNATTIIPEMAMAVIPTAKYKVDILAKRSHPSVQKMQRKYKSQPPIQKFRIKQRLPHQRLKIKPQIFLFRKIYNSMVH
jgi:hypothetical protein